MAQSRPHGEGADVEQGRAVVTQAWETLFRKAVKLIDNAQRQAGSELFWTMGGGTVLMLRHHHRISRDIDIFFRDPQPLGFVNPRLGGMAEEMTSKYDESSGHVKLFFPEGEIDFVASPLMTVPGFENGKVLGRQVRLETDVEIVVKKMWHRGHEAKARDLLDLCVVIEASPDALRAASGHLLRHRDAFVEGIRKRGEILEAQFDELHVTRGRRTFRECAGLATEFLQELTERRPRRGGKR